MKNIVKAFAIILLTLSITELNSCKKDKPIPPVITTAEVTGISPFTAVSGGTITDEGGAAVISRGVCWNTSDNPVTDNNKTSDKGGSGSFISNISQLTPNTTYYIRAYATNSAGTGYGNSLTFKTLGDKPSSVWVNVTEITAGSATLIGSLNANSLTTTVSFEYGLTNSYGLTSVASQSPVNGDANVNVSTALADLTPGRTYHFRMKAENSLGIVFSDDVTFTTLGRLPSVSTMAAVNIQPNSAALNAEVNPNYLSTTVVFEWGLSSSYGNTIAFTENPLTGSTSVLLSAVLTGLTPGMTYHFRVRGENIIGISAGTDMTFKTLGGPPIITTEAATNLQTGSATINGTMNPNYYNTSVSFEWGTTIDYGNLATIAQSPYNGGTTINIGAGISGLAPATTYHYRITATNILGTVYGSDMTFSTNIEDIDNNSYRTIPIGNQLWMAENLKSTKYNDGTPIQNVTDAAVWSSLTTGAYCNFRNDITNSSTYGRLYNCFAVENTSNLCPAGWHVSTESDWNTLISYLGGGTIAGSKLKEAGTTHWLSPNIADNSSGFTALPGGFRDYAGLFSSEFASAAIFWTFPVNSYDPTAQYTFVMSAYVPDIGRGYNYKTEGHSVRCLKN